MVHRPTVFRERVLKIPKPRQQLLDEKVKQLAALGPGDGPPEPRPVDATHRLDACAVNGVKELGDVPIPKARCRRNVTLGKLFPVVGVEIPLPALRLAGCVHQHVVPPPHHSVEGLHEELLLALEMVCQVCA